MALNKKVRRSYGGVLEILHPETTVARVKQTSSGTERSDFSKNLFVLANPAANKFLKVATNGVITQVSSPADFNAAAAAHGHTQAEITYVKSGVWSTVAMTAYDENIVDNAIVDQASFITFLNNGDYKLGVDTFFGLPEGTIARGSNASNQTVFYYAIARYTTVALDSYLTDNTNGKAPLSGGKINKSYLPEYTKGHMAYVGGADLSLGTTTANAVSLSAVFTTLGTNPDEQVGDFKIVTAAGYIKGDEVHGTLGTLDAMIDGPIYLNVGDRIVFVAYNPTGPVFSFAYMHNDFSEANTIRKGVVQLADGTALNRGALNAGTDGKAVIDEAALRAAMRDVLYAPNLRQFPDSDLGQAAHFYVLHLSIAGEPTHTVGSVATGFEVPDSGNVYLVNTTGKLYIYEGPTTGGAWLYYKTLSPFVGNAGDLAVNTVDTSAVFLITDFDEGIYKYIKNPLVEGDILIH